MNFVVCHPRSGSEWLKVTLNQYGYDAKPYSRSKHVLPGNINFHHDGWGYLNGSRHLRANGPPEGLGRKWKWTGREKVLILARDPKDVIVSQWHFLRFRRQRMWLPDLYEFTRRFISNPINFLNRWNLAGLNQSFIFYEDMIDDLSSVTRAAVDFFGFDTALLSADLKPLSLEDTEALSYGDSPNEDKRSRHCRRGEKGVWQEYYSESQRRWIEDQCLKLHPFYERYR